MEQAARNSRLKITTPVCGTSTLDAAGAFTTSAMAAAGGLILLLVSSFSGTSQAQTSQPLLNAPLPSAQLANPSAAVQPSHPSPGPAIRQFSLADFRAQATVTAEGHFLLTVPQICNTASDPQLREILAGRPVQTVAEVEPPSQGQPAWPQIRISRKLISCCSSHARTYTVLADCTQVVLQSKLPTWAKITGTIVYQRQGVELVPILKTTRIEEIPAPLTPILN